MNLHCLTNFLYEFDNGKSTLNNSALTFAAEEQALNLKRENKRPETFSVGQLSGEIWNKCIYDLCDISIKYLRIFGC